MSQEFLHPPRWEGNKCVVEIVATSPNVKFNTTKFLDDLDHKQRQDLSALLGRSETILSQTIEQDISNNQAKLVTAFMQIHNLELDTYLSEVNNG